MFWTSRTPLHGSTRTLVVHTLPWISCCGSSVLFCMICDVVCRCEIRILFELYKSYEPGHNMTQSYEPRHDMTHTTSEIGHLRFERPIECQCWIMQLNSGGKTVDEFNVLSRNTTLMNTNIHVRDHSPTRHWNSTHSCTTSGTMRLGHVSTIDEHQAKACHRE